MRAMRILALLAGIAVAVAVAGCSSPAGRGAPDASAMGCTFASTGASVAAESCTAAVCHPMGAGYESVNVATSSTFHSSFDVDGALAMRSYAVGELRSFDVLLSANGKQYAAGKSISGTVIAGSSATLTVTSVTEPSGMPCNGSAHGSATAMLVEYDPASGMPTGTGVVSVTLGF
jgi:hypothetical protein